jgi:hypothetical protein
VSAEFLQTTLPPLPWIVLFNAACVWHLSSDNEVSADSVPITTSLSFAGSRVAVRAEPHRDKVRLPNGKETPAQPVATASVYRDGAAAFFVMALPEVWRRDARFAGDPSLEKCFLGVLAHEIVHTRHLPAIVAQARALADHYKLATLQLDDDVIQNRFERVRGFSSAFEAERDVLFRAAAEVDAGRRRTLTLRGLSMARARIGPATSKVATRCTQHLTVSFSTWRALRSGLPTDWRGRRRIRRQAMLRSSRSCETIVNTGRRRRGWRCFCRSMR